MSDESMTPDQEELAAAFRTIFPDGTDWAHVVRDDAAWAAFSQPLAAVVAPEFVYEDDVLPDHAGEMYHGLDGLRRASNAYAEPFEDMIYDLERIVGSGDRFVSIHRVRTKARHSGIVQDVQAAYVWTYHDGRLIHLRGFMGADGALKAAGLTG
jgi:ketosteroid isomerase-like protein